MHLDFITLTDIPASQLLDKINIQLSEGRMISTLVGRIEGEGEDINTYDFVATRVETAV